MVDDPKEPTIDFQDWFDGGNIFYRSKDKQRFQYAVNAIIDDEMGLAVIGTNETVLDHYCRMLLARLREHDKFQLEVLLPTDTENLLKRFNEMVEAMSIEQARKAPDDNEPVKLLVINDASLVKDEQWALLERLLADFPGVNVRLILFIDKMGCPNYEKPLGLFGRKLYRWVVETPSFEEAQQLFQAAKEHGYVNAVATLLRQTGLAAAIDPLDFDHNELQEVPPEPTIDADDESADSPSEPRSSVVGRAGFWVVSTVILACAVVAWQVSMQLNEESPMDVKPLPIAELAVIPEAENLISNKSQPQSASQLEKEPQQLQQPAEEQKLDIAVAEMTVDSVQPSLSEPQVPELQIQQPLNIQIASTAKDIVFASSASDFYVQHIVLSDRGEAEDFVDNYPALSRALLLPIQSQGAIVTAVVSGPFSTRLQAEEFTKGLGLPADYWIRRAELLKTVVQFD